MTDDLALLRAHEPVVRLAAGELFVPVSVERFVSRARLVRHDDDDTVEEVAAAGTLDLAALATLGARHDGPGLALSDIPTPEGIVERVRSWLPHGRPSFRGGSRLAQVGPLGRTLDVLSRLSLLVRGAVPGGSAGLAYATQEKHLRPDLPTYYGRVVRDGTWIVCQYWFFYAFNNWRSGFSGVNEHEGDWEQVACYLDGTGVLDADGLPPLRWVAFSAHDETGDDLRRRIDDPDLTMAGPRTPVVFAGAGSHSGAFLPGDYRITVIPPTWGGIVPTMRHLARVLTPWSEAAKGEGFGVPYVDYARGDGLALGPGADLEWTAVPIDDSTPWVRDYRGLWGHDSRDQFGGERGPAGPRYERNTTVRLSWADPVGWAGLAKVAPNPVVEERLVAERIGAIDAELAALETQIAQESAALAVRAAGLDPSTPAVRGLADSERELSRLRMRAVGLRDERDQLGPERRASQPLLGPHAHLRHRRTPITRSARGRDRVLAVWAVVSTPLVLLLLADIARPTVISRSVTAVVLVVLVLAVEAFARGYLLAYLARVGILALLWILLVLFVGSWQPVAYWVFTAAAVLVLLVNLRDALRR